MNKLRALLFGLLLGCLPAAAMAQETWIAYLNGEIDVAADGSVASFKVMESAGKQIDPLVEQQVLDWQFEPVIENGRAMPVKGQAYLTLRGLETEDGALQITVADANFFEFTSGPSKEFVESLGNKLPPPEYPLYPLQEDVMANVIAIVSISRDGAVIDVEFERTDLRYLNSLPSAKKSARHAKYFETAVSRAARSWRLNPQHAKFNDSGVSRSRIPVSFGIPGRNWGRLVSIAGQATDKADSGEKIADLSTSGEMASNRIALLTKLQPLPGG